MSFNAAISKAFDQVERTEVRVAEAGAINRELLGQLTNTCFSDIASRALKEDLGVVVASQCWL